MKKLLDNENLSIDHLSFPTIDRTIMAEARKAEISRKTNETDIQVAINLDSKFDQSININTGIGFLDHVRQTERR